MLIIRIYISSLSLAPELNIGNIALTEIILDPYTFSYNSTCLEVYDIFWKNKINL